MRYEISVEMQNRLLKCVFSRYFNLFINLSIKIIENCKKYNKAKKAAILCQKNPSIRR